VGRTSEIIEAADCCLMVSGSVSLELIARKTPAVVIYRATRLFEFLTRRLVSCQYISLPNLLVDDELLPEFPFSGRIEPWIDPITATLDDWLSNPDSLDSMIDRITTLQQSIGAAGANGRTAEAILGRLPNQALTRAA
jgi:lipid-A-disaccharide synthase